MADTFRHLTFFPTDQLSADKLNHLMENARYLMSTTPSAMLANTGTDVGIKMLTGRVKFSPGGGRSKTVTFGNFFSPGCKPVVVGSVQAEAASKIFLTTSGIGGAAPSAEGAVFHVFLQNGDKDKSASIDGVFHVNWVAIGY